MIRYGDTERWPKIITNFPPANQDIFLQKETEALAREGWGTVPLDARLMVGDITALKDNLGKYLKQGIGIFDTSCPWEYIEQTLVAGLDPKGERGEKAKQIMETFKTGSHLKVFDDKSLADNLCLFDHDWEELGGKRSVLILKNLEVLKRENPHDVKLQQVLNCIIVYTRSGFAMPTPRFLTSKSKLISYMDPDGHPIQLIHDYHDCDAQKSGFLSPNNFS